MLKKYFLVLFCIYSVVLFSQNSKIDSLKNILGKSNSKEFSTYHLLASEYVQVDAKLSLFYNNLSKKLIKTDKDLGQYLILFAGLKTIEGDLQLSELKANEGLKLAISAKDFNTISSGYNVLARTVSMSGDFNKSEYYMTKAYNYALMTADNKKILTSIINYGSTLAQNGKIESGIKIYESAQNYFYKGCEFEKGHLHYNLSRLFLDKSKLTESLINLKKAENLFLKINNNSIFYEIYGTYGEIYTELKNENETLYYLNKASKYVRNDTDKSDIFYVKAQLFLNVNKLNFASKNINEAILLNEKNEEFSRLGESYLLFSEILTVQKNYDLADDFLKKAIQLFKENDELANLRDSYEKIVKNYFLLNGQNNYELFFDEYLKLNLDFYNAENANALSVLNEKYKVSEKEAKIKTQQLQIQKEQTNKYFAFLGFGILLLSAVGGFIFYRNKQNQTNLKTQNTLLGLQQNLVEAELYSLNKQLDPHEIKNLLASISPEIQEKAPESYKKMLKLFNLTKASLNSSSITDSLENQLQQIDDFLSLEKSMLSIPLEYIIENNIKNTETQIPRLLLKNLVENSLKHGIKPKSNGGKISVKINEKDNFIQIAVDDTGIGRQNAISLDSGIGTTTYQKLFATLNPKNKENATFQIIDKAEGTKVAVNIPLDYKYL